MIRHFKSILQTLTLESRGQLKITLIILLEKMTLTTYNGLFSFNVQLREFKVPRLYRFINVLKPTTIHFILRLNHMLVR